MRLLLVALLLFPLHASATDSWLARLDRVQIDQMGKKEWLSQCRHSHEASHCQKRLVRADLLPRTDTTRLSDLDKWMKASDRPVSP